MLLIPGKPPKINTRNPKVKPYNDAEIMQNGLVPPCPILVA